MEGCHYRKEFTGRMALNHAYRIIEDTRYVLNALNFGWWTNGTLYRYNDPDHLALYHSVIDGRGVTTEAEARSRYLSVVISGTLMILSDNYGPEGNPDMTEVARQRTKELANNPKLNELARFGKAFTPVELGSDTASCYTLCYEDRYFAALFNFLAHCRTIGFSPARGGIPERGQATELHTGMQFLYDGCLEAALGGHDCAIFEICSE